MPEKMEHIAIVIVILVLGILILRPSYIRSEELPDLYISEFSLSPSIPSLDKTVSVRVQVYNQGSAVSRPFTVEWWPGENYHVPGCTWRVEKLVPRGGRVLTCDGYVFPSWYQNINTKVVADSANEVTEQNEGNNARTMSITVKKSNR